MLWSLFLCEYRVDCKVISVFKIFTTLITRANFTLFLYGFLQTSQMTGPQSADAALERGSELFVGFAISVGEFSLAFPRPAAGINLRPV